MRVGSGGEVGGRRSLSIPLSDCNSSSVCALVGGPEVEVGEIFSSCISLLSRGGLDFLM